MGGFPSDADLHRREFPPQRRYKESFYRTRGPSSSDKVAARRSGAHYPRFKGPGKGGRPYLLDGRAVETGSSTTSGYRFHRASVWLPCRITRLSNRFSWWSTTNTVWLPCRITQPPNAGRHGAENVAVWLPCRITRLSNGGKRYHVLERVWLPCRIARLSNATKLVIIDTFVWLPCRIARLSNPCGRNRRPDAGSGA